MKNKKAKSRQLSGLLPLLLLAGPAWAQPTFGSIQAYLRPAINRFFWMTGPHRVGELADWTQLYDGIFFIREMTPCGPGSLGRPASRLPGSYFLLYQPLPYEPRCCRHRRFHRRKI